MNKAINRRIEESGASFSSVFPPFLYEALTHSSWGEALSRGQSSLQASASEHQAYLALGKSSFESRLDFRVTCRHLYPFLVPHSIL